MWEFALLAVILTIGSIDDHIHLSILIRLFIQSMIATLFIVMGNIFTPFNRELIDIVFTVLGILVMINAINLIDILDGLAGNHDIFSNRRISIHAILLSSRYAL